MNHRVLVRAIIIVGAIVLIIQGLAEMVHEMEPWNRLHLFYLNVTDSGYWGDLWELHPRGSRWFVLLAGGVVLLIRASRLSKMLVRTNRFCHSCGYDLKGSTSSTCPECGDSRPGPRS